MVKRNSNQLQHLVRSLKGNRLNEDIDNYLNYLLNEVKMSKILKENPMIVKQRSLAITGIRLVADNIYKTSRIIEFEVTGSGGDLYKVVFYFKDKYNIWGEIKVYCSCPYTRWWGPSWNGKVEGYRLWQMGKDVPPDTMDPKRKNKICKHILAAFNKVPEVHKQWKQKEFPFVKKMEK